MRYLLPLGKWRKYTKPELADWADKLIAKVNRDYGTSMLAADRRTTKGELTVMSERKQWIKDAAAELYDKIRGGGGYSTDLFERRIEFWYAHVEAPAPSQTERQVRHDDGEGTCTDGLSCQVCYGKPQAAQSVASPHSDGIGGACPGCEDCKPSAVASPTLLEIVAKWHKIYMEAEPPQFITGVMEACARDYATTLEARVAAQKNIIATLGEGKAAAEERAEKAEADRDAARCNYDYWRQLAESLQKDGPLAQSVDQRTHNSQDAGPTPARPTNTDALAVSLRDVGEIVKRWNSNSMQAESAMHRISLVLSRLSTDTKEEK